ncbi:MAG: hypothetical protein KDE27_19995 [Planctomycetes bacterium]|nr:hypothetical protein [Planctomycetota bacterium]
MTYARTVAVLLPLFLATACGGEAGAAAKPSSVAESLTSVLKGITDSKSAEAAKPELETLSSKLSTAIASLKSTASEAGGDAKDTMGALADKAKAAVKAFTPELTKSLSGLSEQVTRLMNNEEVKKVIGPVLEKLKGMVAG